MEVESRGGNKRHRTGDRTFLNVGTHASIPGIPGILEAKPRTHVEILELERIPGHLVVIGGGYVWLELAQAKKRFGNEVTVIESGPHSRAVKMGMLARLCFIFSG